MARYLHVKAGFVVNVVEYGFTPPTSDNGFEIILDPTGTTGAGAAFDIVAARAVERRPTAINLMNAIQSTAIPLDEMQSHGILFRAVASVLVDEINTLRDLLTQQASAVAAASSLADLKTRWAALPTVPQRTLSQARTAISAKINAGTVDS